jgi:hypothetical protein
MGRNREYADDAAKQRAYRERKAEQEKQMREELRRYRRAAATKVAHQRKRPEGK